MLAATAIDSGWSWAPGPIFICLTLSAVFTWRFIRVRRVNGPRGAEWWRPFVWFGGVLALVAALISPIDTLADKLFVMHMAQHVLLLDIAPIFLTVALSKVLLRPIARTVLEIERALGPIAHPIFALVAYIVIMWVWHAPALYDAALRNDTIHTLEHVCFATAGFLYWWHLLSPVRGHRLTGIQPVAYMIITKIGVGLLGIIITFAPSAIYGFYDQGLRPWGLDPIDDQSAAGALMALEQSIVMGVALAYLFIRALNESEKRDARLDAKLDAEENRRAAESGV